MPLETFYCSSVLVKGVIYEFLPFPHKQRLQATFFPNQQSIRLNPYGLKSTALCCHSLTVEKMGFPSSQEN